MVLLSLLVTAGAISLLRLAPLIPRLLDDTANLVLAAMATAAVAFLLLDSRSRQIVVFGWKKITEKIAALFIEADPVAQVRDHVGALRVQHQTLVRQLNQFRGQMHLLLERIVVNGREVDTLLATGEAADGSDETLRLLQARRVGRLQESNERLQETYRRMQEVYRLLQRMQARSELVLADTSDLASQREQEYKAIRESSSAMRSARTMLQGHRERQELSDQSLRSLAADVDRQMGALDRFLSISSDFMETMDLREGVYSSQGMALLQAWEQDQAREERDGNGHEPHSGPPSDELLLREPPLTRPNGHPDGNRYDRFFQ
jgi:hypothetical protein